MGMGGLGSVVGMGSVVACFAGPTHVLVFLNMLEILANWLLCVLGRSDEEDTLASLPASDPAGMATDGAAVLRRVVLGKLGASWLEGPVSGDNVNDVVVLDIVAAARCCCGAASSLDVLTRTRQAAT